MQADEKQIRELVTQWMDATRRGDAESVLSLMTDDVVLLLPGRPPMHKAEFSAQARAQATPAAPAAPSIDGNSDIQEIKVLGDWAFMWSRLSVTVTPPDGSAPIVRAGHTLTVQHKQDGRWLLARDANLLAPVGAKPA